MKDLRKIYWKSKISKYKSDLKNSEDKINKYNQMIKLEKARIWKINDEINDNNYIISNKYQVEQYLKDYLRDVKVLSNEKYSKICK